MKKLRLPIWLGRRFIAMRRRTFRQIKARTESSLHHHVYVVLLAPEAARSRELRGQKRQRDPTKPCVYVGMTGLSPDERFANHKSGVKAAGIVKKHGVRLLPELYEIFNPMPFDVAVAMEQELAEDLRKQGFAVAGGH